MEDRTLLKVIVQNETGMEKDDLLKYEVDVYHLENFLSRHKQKGREGLFKMLDHLRETVEWYYQRVLVGKRE